MSSAHCGQARLQPSPRCPCLVLRTSLRGSVPSRRSRSLPTWSTPPPELAFGTEEWARVYATCRNTIEGWNGYVKDPAQEDLAAPGRRRCVAAPPRACSAPFSSWPPISEGSGPFANSSQTGAPARSPSGHGGVARAFRTTGHRPSLSASQLSCTSPGDPHATGNGLTSL